MKEIIKTILTEWKERKLPDIHDRQIDLFGYTKLTIPKIIVITGFRRVGKTYIALFEILIKEP